MPVGLHAALRWRMAKAKSDAWGSMRGVAVEQPGLVAWVRDEVAARGPVAAAEIEHDGPRETGHWGWNWSTVKRALEFLFWAGEVTAAERTASFARATIARRVLPTPCWTRRHRRRRGIQHALARAARSIGVAAETSCANIPDAVPGRGRRCEKARRS